MRPIPIIRPDEAWDSPSVDTWRELLRKRVEDDRIPVWADAAAVPATPTGGEIGVVTFAATSGTGLYFHDGTQWHVVNTTPTTLP